MSLYDGKASTGADAKAGADVKASEAKKAKSGPAGPNEPGKAAPAEVEIGPEISHGLFFEDLFEGMVARFGKTVTDADIVMFAGISGDTNPVHLDQAYAETTMFKGRIAHGMLSASFISTVLGTKLPGPGCIYLSQSLRFLAPVRVGDTVVAEVMVSSINAEKKRISLATKCKVGNTKVIEGDALVIVPSRG